jgi:mevalonate kinase
MSTASAPGKIILFGEHAVVYRRPALAVPLSALRVSVTVEAASGPSWIVAEGVGLDGPVQNLDDGDPLRLVIDRCLERAASASRSEVHIEIRSDLPVAGGMGSGAAVSVALIRAMGDYLKLNLDDSTVNDMAYEIERVHHGTPSGIDNTVITYEQSVYFIRGQGPMTFQIAKPLDLVIADSGQPSPTSETVAQVRKAWQADMLTYENWFDEIGEISRMARFALETGRNHEVGALMDANQRLLERLEVSSPTIERLVQAARRAGAAGAKLSGGGRGGNVIACCAADQVDSLRHALLDAGAAHVFHSRLGQGSPEETP